MQSFELQGAQYYEELQWKLEQEADHEAVLRFLKERADRISSGDISGDPLALNMVRAAFEKVKDSLREDAEKTARGTGAKYRQIIRGVPLDVLTGVVLTEVISLGLSYTAKGMVLSFQTMARRLGLLIVTELQIIQATAVNPLYMQRVHEDLKDRNSKSTKHRRAVYSKAYSEVMGDDASLVFSNTDLIHIGKFGVDACYKAGLITLERYYDKGGSVVAYTLSPEVFDYIMNSDSKSLIRRVSAAAFTKMLCEPDPWVSAYGGGFLTPRRKSRYKLIALSHTHPRKAKEYLSKFHDSKMPMVFGVANYLQSVPFTYHNPTVELLRQVWELGGGILGVPTRTHEPKPEFPLPTGWDKDAATPEELQQFRIWKRKTFEWYTAQTKHRSASFSIWNTLRGVSYGGGDCMYFPVFMDKRGRWYYNANPNPQGGDIEKAILHFHNRKKLGVDGLYWLKVHIANCLGFDSQRMDARVKYVEDNWELLKQGVLNPLDHHEVFGHESPMTAYSACYELYRALELPDPTEYYTGIPVHMDATVSGTQHFSALLRDEVGGKYTNLIDLLGESKADMYTAVANASLDSIKDDLYNARSVEHAKLWLGLGIPRSLAKKPCMTYTYGVTLYSTQDYIYDWLDEEHPELAKTIPITAVTYLARKLFDGIEATIPATVRGMEYLREVGRELGKDGEMSWTNPCTGMYVEHAYYKNKDKRVKVNSAGLVVVVVRDPTEEMRGVGMVSALAPNFIHSLDAAHLTLVGNEFKERGLDLIGIHDSFGTHPSDVGTMHEVIRTKFVELYQHDHLKLFADSVGSAVTLPVKGCLDLNEVLDSEFFFS